MYFFGGTSSKDYHILGSVFVVPPSYQAPPPPSPYLGLFFQCVPRSGCLELLRGLQNRGFIGDNGKDIGNYYSRGRRVKGLGFRV